MLHTIGDWVMWVLYNVLWLMGILSITISMVLQGQLIRADADEVRTVHIQRVWYMLILGLLFLVARRIL